MPQPPVGGRPYSWRGCSRRQIHRFFVAGIFAPLLVEAVGLVFRVVQPRKAVGDLAADDKQLEALGDAGVVVRGAGQRRDFHRVVDDEGRVPQLGFGVSSNSASCRCPGPAPGQFRAKFRWISPFSQSASGQLRVGVVRL